MQDICPNSFWIKSYGAWGFQRPVPVLWEKIFVGTSLNRENLESRDLRISTFCYIVATKGKNSRFPMASSTWVIKPNLLCPLFCGALDWFQLCNKTFAFHVEDSIRRHGTNWAWQVSSRMISIKSEALVHLECFSGVRFSTPERC